MAILGIKVRSPGCKSCALTTNIFLLRKSNFVLVLACILDYWIIAQGFFGFGGVGDGLGFVLGFFFLKNLQVLVWFAWYHMILQINVSDEQSLNFKRQYFNFLQLFGVFF